MHREEAFISTGVQEFTEDISRGFSFALDFNLGFDFSM